MGATQGLKAVATEVLACKGEQIHQHNIGANESKSRRIIIIITMQCKNEQTNQRL